MQAIEDKGDGMFVAKVHVSPDADKEKIHAEITATYEQKLQLQATQYEAQLAAKDGQLADYRVYLKSINSFKSLDLSWFHPSYNN